MGITEKSPRPGPEVSDWAADSMVLLCRLAPFCVALKTTRGREPEIALACATPLLATNNATAHSSVRRGSLFISINSFVKLFADSNPVPGRDVGLLLNQRQTLPGRSFDGSPHPTQRLLEGLCQHGPTQSRRQENKQPKASSLYRQIADGSNDWRRPHDNVQESSRREPFIRTAGESSGMFTIQRKPSPLTCITSGTAS